MTTSLLPRTLSANAVFSAISGSVLITLAVARTDAFGVPPWMLGLVGAGLLPFAWLVHRTARDPQPAIVRVVVLADAAWVVAAGVILSGFPGALSPQGSIALAVASLAVAGFAIVQFVALQHAPVAGSETAVG